MLIKILIAVAVIVVVLAGIIAARPSDFRVTRSAAMSAARDIVFEQVNELHNWEAWSPWAKMDPNAKTAYEGPSAGVGAAFAWSGNMKIGQGRMTITDSRPSELVRFKLDFEKPMKGTSTAEFTFKPEGNRTVVTWSMCGKNCFMGKAMGLFMNCDKMMSAQFDQGLAQMKALVEAKGSEHLAVDNP